MGSHIAILQCFANFNEFLLFLINVDVFYILKFVNILIYIMKFFIIKGNQFEIYIIIIN